MIPLYWELVLPPVTLGLLGREDACSVVRVTYPACQGVALLLLWNEDMDG